MVSRRACSVPRPQRCGAGALPSRRRAGKLSRRQPVAHAACWPHAWRKGEPTSSSLTVHRPRRGSENCGLCCAQAMKLMNEIEADVSGTVVKFVAEDAAPIEPGDVICIVEP